MILPVKIKKLSKDATIPVYKHKNDAGFDLTSVEDVNIIPGQTVRIKTGLAFSIPEGYEMQIRPRSGLSADTSFRVITGTIDSGYHGEVSIIAENRLKTYFNSGEISGMIDTLSFRVNKGDRIAQGIISPVLHAVFQEVNELNDSDRGRNGFGSTGVK